MFSTLRIRQGRPILKNVAVQNTDIGTWRYEFKRLYFYVFDGSAFLGILYKAQSKPDAKFPQNYILGF